MKKIILLGFVGLMMSCCSLIDPTEEKIFDIEITYQDGTKDTIVTTVQYNANIDINMDVNLNSNGCVVIEFGDVYETKS